MRKFFLITFKVALTLLGLGLFWNVLSQARLFYLMKFLSNLSSWAWLLLFFYLFAFCLDTWGWRLVLGKKWSHKIPFGDLSLIRLQGESFNMISPFIDIGGEAVKISLLFKKYKIPKKILISSMFVHRTLLLITAIFFIMLGFLLFNRYFPSYTELKIHLTYGLFIFTVVTGIFIFLQQKGLFLKITRPIGKEIARFYKNHPDRVAEASLLHFISWLFNAVEAYLMLQVAGLAITFPQALMLEALVQLVRTASFFIPGNLGVQEGAYAYLAQSLGFPLEAGIAVSLFMRARQIIWMLMGFALWANYKWLAAARAKFNLCYNTKP